jgi:hypothetical protein
VAARGQCGFRVRVYTLITSTDNSLGWVGNRGDLSGQPADGHTVGTPEEALDCACGLLPQRPHRLDPTPDELTDVTTSEASPLTAEHGVWSGVGVAVRLG